MDTLVPRFWTAKRYAGGRVSLLQGRGRIVDEHGKTIWEEPWQSNALMDLGEKDIIDVYFRKQTNPDKFMALLTAAPAAETETLATVLGDEVHTPGSNGYNRVEIDEADWGAPALDSGDYQSTAAEKTFGPASGAAWTAMTHVALVSVATGTSGIPILYIALSGTTTIAIGQSFKYTMRVKLQ